MNDKKTEALKLALQALEYLTYEGDGDLETKGDFYASHLSGSNVTRVVKPVTAAIREALMSVPDGADSALDRMAENARELGLDYEPVQDGGIVTAGGFDPRTRRTWVGLTDEEIDRLWSQSLADTESETWLPLREFARAIEAAHGIKENT